MGFINSVITSVILAWILGPYVKEFLVSMGLGTTFNIETNMIYVGTGFLLFIFFRIFARPKALTGSSQVEVIKSSKISPQLFFSQGDSEKLKDLFSNGNMIESIKMIRSMGNFGLKEAKDLAEQLKTSGFGNVVVKSSGITIDSDGSIIGSNTGSSAEERLKKLNELKEKNLITQSEYEEKRREILGEL